LKVILGNVPDGEKDPSLGKGRNLIPVVIPKRATKNLDECSDVGNPHGGSVMLIRGSLVFTVIKGRVRSIFSTVRAKHLKDSLFRDYYDPWKYHTKPYRIPHQVSRVNSP